MYQPTTRTCVHRSNRTHLVVTGLIAVVVLATVALTPGTALGHDQRWMDPPATVMGEGLLDAQRFIHEHRAIDLPAAVMGEGLLDAQRFIEENVTWQMPFKVDVNPTDDLLYLEMHMHDYHVPDASYLIKVVRDECSPTWLGPNYIAMDQFRCVDW